MLLDRSSTCTPREVAAALSSCVAPADAIALSCNRSSRGQPALCSRGSSACAPASPAPVDDKSRNSRERRQLSVRAIVASATGGIGLRARQRDRRRRRELSTPHTLVAPSWPRLHALKLSICNVARDCYVTCQIAHVTLRDYATHQPNKREVPETQHINQQIHNYQTCSIGNTAGITARMRLHPTSPKGFDCPCVTTCCEQLQHNPPADQLPSHAASFLTTALLLAQRRWQVQRIPAETRSLSRSRRLRNPG